MSKKRAPFFEKVSNLLKILIFIAKMRKPNFPKLIFLKKSSKLKKFKLLKHYNYGYIQEYQFSPSKTPLIHFPRKQFKKRSHKYIFSLFFLSRCLGRFRTEGLDGNYPLNLEALPAIDDADVARELMESMDSYGEEDSVDERAERFIERFYEEMRMQRNESFVQLNGMMNM